MIAWLGMYDRPELTEANDEFWALIRDTLGFGPVQRAKDQDAWGVWLSPELLLAQTCGLPYRSRLYPKVSLVGTPDYGVKGCPPGYYQSVIVGRSDCPPDLNDLSSLHFAYNDRGSQSGWAAFWGHVDPGRHPKSLIESGSHRASAKMVAEESADIAALDIVTWNIINRHDEFARNLTVLARTKPTPGLPFITAQHDKTADIGHAVKHAITHLSPNSKSLLQLKDFVQISQEDYLTVPMPPE